MDLSSGIANRDGITISSSNGTTSNNYSSQVDDEYDYKYMYTATVCTPSLLRLVQNEVEQPRKIQFPNHLHSLLHNTDDEIVSWNQQGTAFCIHDRARFMEIAPRYFKLKLFRSFTRQLNMWGFHAAGRGQTIYHHPKFQRDNVELCYKMIRREKTKKCASAKSSNSSKNEDHHPTFVFAGEQQQPQHSSPKSSNTCNSPFQEAPSFAVVCDGVASASPTQKVPSSYAEMLGDSNNNRMTQSTLQTTAATTTASFRTNTATNHHHQQQQQQQHNHHPTNQTPQSLSSILCNDMELIKRTVSGLPLHQIFSQPPFVGTAATTNGGTSIGHPRHVSIESTASTTATNSTTTNNSAFDSTWNNDQTSWCPPNIGFFDNATGLDTQQKQQQQQSSTEGYSYDSEKDRQLFAALFKHLETKPSLNHIHTTDIDPRPLEQMIANPGGVL